MLAIKKEEVRSVVWAWIYIFSLFLSYYILRPIRDELGVAGGVRNLPWLFTGTLIAMLVLHPLFSWAVKNWPRETFIKLVYHFFIAHLLLFFIALQIATPQQNVWIGRAFFIWVSVFNLFVISVFWSFVVDIFNSEQGKRLFAFLATGATCGGIVGSRVTAMLVDILGQSGLMIVSMVLLEVSIFAACRLLRQQFVPKPTLQEERIGGGIFTGITHMLHSPYLCGIAGFILLYSLTSTILYFEQASIAANHFSDRASRTAFFANIDFWVNLLTLACQLFLTRRLLGWLGVACTLCALPLITLLGFSWLAFAPSITIFIIIQVIRRVSNYAIARPSREILFTSISHEDRYKTKNFIDTFVYRCGDQLSSWGYAGLLAAGLTGTGIAIVAIPITGIWLLLSFWLGTRHEHDAKQRATKPLPDALSD